MPPDVTPTVIVAGDPTAPTQGALAANEVFLEIPAGYADCGSSILTSGWPTTTVFNPEIELTCLNEAIASQSQSQYVYWGRDEAGGISGAIIRVDSAAEPLFLVRGQQPVL